MNLLNLIDGHEVLIRKNFTPNSTLNYCTANGIEYFIGYNGNKAAIAAVMYDENLCFIDKPDIREMSLTARVKGIEHVTLFTNYGIELHSKHETPQTVGLDKIVKPIF